MTQQTAVERKHMENRHSFIQGQKLMPEGTNAEGYLFKRTSKGFKSWVRRWFCIDNNRLVYTKQLSEGMTVMEDDLRLCSVKVASSDVDRRFCFEVRSPTRIHVLQATSEDECLRWVSALQAGVEAAYHDSAAQPQAGAAAATIAGSASAPQLAAGAHAQHGTTGHTVRDEASGTAGAPSAPNGRWPEADAAGSGESTGKSAKFGGMIAKSSSSLKTMNQAQLILSVPGNGFCCDCGSAEPCWASCNLGITLCIECSGIHRSLGVHISKVRSLTLDSWEPEMLKVMAEIGNATFNAIYEANVPKGAARLEPTSDRGRRETWIKSKYLKKTFVRHLLADLPHDRPATPVSAHGSSGEMEEKARSLKWSVQIRNRKTLPRRQAEQQQLPPTAVSASMTARSGDDPAVCRRELQEDVVLFGARVNDADACRPSFDSESESDEDVIAVASPSSSASALQADDGDRESRTSLEEVEQLDANMLLYRAAEARNIPVMMEALANGANVNWQCPRAHMKTPLIRAVESGSLAACEFLLLNGARVDLADGRGRPALHHATLTGHTAQVCQLLKRGANQRHRDADGIDAIMLAVKAEQADIVTLLRVADLRQQMTDADPGIQSDDMFNDVFRDFTNMASSDPDKLKRDVTRALE